MGLPKGQKIVIIDINADTEAFIQDALNNGFAIWSITSLTPTFAKLLIIYAEPSEPAP